MYCDTHLENHKGAIRNLACNSIYMNCKVGCIQNKSIKLKIEIQKNTIRETYNRKFMVVKHG